MTPEPAEPAVVQPASRPDGCRAVPLLTEPSVGHYPEFRRFLVATFGLDDRAAPSGMLRLADRFYELVWLGRSGQPWPSGVEIHALVPGVEPLDPDVADRDVWAIQRWLVAGVGGDWTVDALETTGRIQRAGQAVGRPAVPQPEPTGELLAFDLYGTLVDPLAIAGELARILPRPEAERVAAAWRRAQIDYAFRLTVMGGYQDFAEVTSRALDAALSGSGHVVDADARSGLLAAYDALAPFPDAGPALQALSAAGVEMAVLSNGSPAMLEAGLAAAGLRAFFGRVLSVDAVRAYKPHPAVYHYAASVTGRPIGSIRLVSCNPFDVVGAAHAGMRTVWINRSGTPFDTLGPQPDSTVGALTEVLDVLRPA